MYISKGIMAREMKIQFRLHDCFRFSIANANFSIIHIWNKSLSKNSLQQRRKEKGKRIWS